MSGINVRFVTLSNGNLHYFWDLKTSNHHIITSIPTHDSITNHISFEPHPDTLVNEIIENDYVVFTQKPKYATDPQWTDESSRNTFIYENFS